MPLLFKKIVKLAKKEAEKPGLSLEEHLVDLVVRGSLSLILFLRHAYVSIARAIASPYSLRCLLNVTFPWLPASLF